MMLARLLGQSGWTRTNWGWPCSSRGLHRLAEAQLLADALEQRHAVRVVVGEEGHQTGYFSLATSDLRPMVRVMKSRSRLGLRAGEYSRP